MEISCIAFPHVQALQCRCIFRRRCLCLRASRLHTIPAPGVVAHFREPVLAAELVAWSLSLYARKAKRVSRPTSKQREAVCPVCSVPAARHSPAGVGRLIAPVTSCPLAPQAKASLQTHRPNSRSNRAYMVSLPTMTSTLVRPTSLCRRRCDWHMLIVIG